MAIMQTIVKNIRKDVFRECRGKIIKPEIFPALLYIEEGYQRQSLYVLYSCQIVYLAGGIDAVANFTLAKSGISVHYLTH